MALAFLLAAILLPVGFVFSLACSLKDIPQYLYNILIGIDQLANAVCYALFNRCLITAKATSKFGNPDETISSVLGKNKDAGTLTWCGIALCWLLDVIQKNHVENAINN